MTKVVHFSSVHAASDPRIYHRECRSLVQAGYDVTLLVPGRSGDINGRVRLRTVDRPDGRLERMARTGATLYRAAIEEDADIYHFHDPELLPVGLLLKLAGRTVIYDVHEDVPKQLRSKEWLRYAVFRRVLACAAGPVEWLGGRGMDAVVVAAPEIGVRFPPEKTVLVRNFVRLADVDVVEPIDDPSMRMTAIYPGTLSRTRGIREIVAAMEHLEGEVELWLLGAWTDSRLERECRGLPGWEYTRYFGRVSPEQVYRRMKAADVGLHVPYTVANYSSGLAVKGFEFMACGLPMVMSDEPGKRRTFGDCALFADPRDPKSIATQIRRLLDNPELAKGLGRLGRKLVEERYIWEREAEKLIALYDRLEKTN